MPYRKLNAIDARLLSAEQTGARELRRLGRTRRQLDRLAEDLKHSLGEPGHLGTAQPEVQPKGAKP